MSNTGSLVGIPRAIKWVAYLVVLYLGAAAGIILANVMEGGPFRLELAIIPIKLWQPVVLAWLFVSITDLGFDYHCEVIPE